VRLRETRDPRPATLATRSASAGVTERFPVATFWIESHSYRRALASGVTIDTGTGSGDALQFKDLVQTAIPGTKCS
jgi:hypothetical protein